MPRRPPVGKTGGGRYDPDEGFVFFMVIAPPCAPFMPIHRWTLIGIDQLYSDGGVADLRARLDFAGSETLVDSGVYVLAHDHAQANGITLPEALAIAPDVMPKFDRLLARYVDIVREFEPHLWGYIELDQGGPAGKRETRAYLEAQGLRPIPVYHPLNDGYDYLDELLERYDRICVGNIVDASAELRRAMMTLIWERRRRHKRKIWIHMLGYTPGALANAYPINSADSSIYVYAIKFGPTMSYGRAMLAPFDRAADQGYAYDPATEDPERGLAKKRDLLAWMARTDMEAWRRQWADLERVMRDVDPWPPVLPAELDPTPARPPLRVVR